MFRSLKRRIWHWRTLRRIDKELEKTQAKDA